MKASCVTKFSGKWDNGTKTGVFQLNVNNTASNSNTNITSHLLFSKQLGNLWCSSLPYHLVKHKKSKSVLVSYVPIT